MKITTQASAYILAISIIALLLGAASFWSVDTAVDGSRSSITERDAALQRARENGGEYSFSTGFTPGLGSTVAPDQIKKDFLKNNEGALTN